MIASNLYCNLFINTVLLILINALPMFLPEGAISRHFFSCYGGYQYYLH